VSTLAIARRCHWRYEDVENLDAEVYAVLVEELTKEQAEADRRSDRF
jgi:hypothetical protein